VRRTAGSVGSVRRTYDQALTLPEEVPFEREIPASAIRQRPHSH